VNLRHVEIGADAEHVVMFRIDPTRAGLSPEGAAAFHDEVIARVSALPSTADAAEGVVPILSNNTWGSGVVLDTGVRDSRPERNAISPGYFRTLGTPVVEGREFSAADGPTTEKVAVVNETFARLFLDGRAIGRRIGPAETTGRAEAIVIGVVRDGKYSNLREDDAPMWFIPRVQLEELGHSDTAERIRSGVATLYVRINGEPGHAIAAVLRAIGEINPRVMVSATKTVAAQVDDQLAVERLLARLAGAFAAIAFFLAGLGLYGVTAYDVATRTREFGVRMAIGATRGGVIRLVLRQASAIIAGGVGAGLLVSLALVQSTRTLLFGIEPADPLAFAAGTALVTSITLVAAAIPAYRASRVNPAELLR
jgi:predicted permease